MIAAVLDDRAEWHQVALNWIATYAASGRKFTVEDIRHAMRPAPSGSCYGNAFQAARKAGIITCAGYTESTTPSRKNGVIRVWRATPKETDMNPDDVQEIAEAQHDKKCADRAGCPDRYAHIQRSYIPHILRDRILESQKELAELKKPAKAQLGEGFGIAEETLDAKILRLERQDAKVQVIDLILSYRNKTSDDERLRQIRVVVE